VAKNALCSRTDLVWKHEMCIDGEPITNQCKFCQKIIRGGVYYMKHHLAGTQKDVIAQKCDK